MCSWGEIPGRNARPIAEDELAEAEHVNPWAELHRAVDLLRTDILAEAKKAVSVVEKMGRKIGG